MVLESDEGRLARDAGAEGHERLRAEVDELRASQERLVRSSDADRRRLERELHDGLQQRLLALAVELQLAESDPAVASDLAGMRRDVEQALGEARRLAERIYAPLELGGLAVALRAAAASSGTRATVEVAGGPSYRDEVARTVFLCWIEALEAGDGDEPAIRVREEDAMLVFELSAGAGAAAGLERLRDRAEALGGSLELGTAPTGGARASGSLPL